MLTDHRHYFSDAQAVTTTTDSTNHIDLQGIVSNIGGAQPSEENLIHLGIYVNAAFAGLTSLTVSVLTSDNVDKSSAVLLNTDKVMLAAELTAGRRIGLSVLPLGCRRYVWLVYTVVGTASAGRINAFLNLGVQTNR